MAMRILPPPQLRISTPLLHLRRRNLSIKAVDSDKNATADSSSSSAASPPAPSDGDGGFENRLAQVRLKYRSGTGKKAEQRRSRKSGGAKKAGGSVFLPPVPLKEAVSGGLRVDFGFSPYTERLNGRLAALGLAALLLVELGSGQSLIRYHSAPILFVQIYTIAAVSAVFVKYEKEKISIWPRNSSPSSTSSPSSSVVKE